jgi:hypothetical protein
MLERIFMRTPLSVLTVLAALPALALAQSLFTLSPAPRDEGLPQWVPLPSTETARMDARSGGRLRVDSGFTLPEREVREWTVSLEPALPPLSLGEGDVKLSGPLVDTFRLQARTENQLNRSLGQRILDLPVLNLFVPQPWPKLTRGGRYFAWGGRDVPWMMVCDRHHDSEQGAWLTIH